MMGIGWPQLLIVVFVALLLFGHRLPSAMRSLGRGIREFKDGMNTESDEHEDDDDTPAPRIERSKKAESGSTVSEKTETTA